MDMEKEIESIREQVRYLRSTADDFVNSGMSETACDYNDAAETIETLLTVLEGRLK